MMCGIKLKDRVPSKELRERETRIKLYNFGTTAKCCNGMAIC